MWQWLYKLGSPRHFYDMTTGFMRWLAVGIGIGTLVLRAGENPPSCKRREAKRSAQKRQDYGQ
jgi:hypothetical protein